MKLRADPDYLQGVVSLQKPIVVISFEDDTGLHCVDVLEIPGQGFGFREFRRDPEDPHGWRPTGLAYNCTIGSYDHALIKARKAAQWLNKNSVKQQGRADLC